MIDVTQAVARAKAYVKRLFAGESILHVGIEEVKYDEEQEVWNVTIGFFREWDAKAPPPTPPYFKSIVGKHHQEWNRRTFKVLAVEGESGKVRSMTNRVFSASE